MSTQLRFMSILSLFLLSFGLSAESYQGSEWKILDVWAKQLQREKIAQDQFTQFFLGGISPQADYFLMSGMKNYLSARSLVSAEPIWRVKLKANSQASWRVTESFAYGGDTKGNLYKVSLETGEILWRSEVKGVILSRPSIHEGRVFVLNSYGDLLAFNEADGKWLWQQKDPQDSNLGLWSSEGPVIFAGRVVVGFPSGSLQAFEPANGARVWTESFSAALPDGLGLNDLRSVAGNEDFLIASSFNGDVKAWQREGPSKKLLWQKRFSLHVPASFSEDSNFVYISDRQGKVHAVELASGFSKWNFKLPEGIATSVRESEDYVWFGSTAGEIFILDNTEGQLVAKTPSTESSIYNPPVLLPKNEALYVTDRAIIRRVKLMRTRTPYTGIKELWSKIF